MLGAFTLTLSLFRLPVPIQSPVAFLNSPIIGVLAVVFMIFFTILSPALYNKSQRDWAQTTEDGKLGNRIFIQIGTLPFTEPKNGLDM